MLRRADVQLNVVRGTQQRIESLEPCEGFQGAADIEEVSLLGEDDDGLGGHCRQKVVVVESQGDGPRRALLGIGGEFVFQVSAEGGDETGRSPHRPARFQAAQPGGHRAAAGVAGDADVLGVHLFPRQEIIESADAVPGPPHAKKFAYQELLIACIQMLADANAPFGFESRVHVLQAFSLANRIENKRHVSLSGQSLGKRLIRLRRFAVGGMAADTDHPRQRELAPLGEIQIAGHEKTGAAFKDYFFDFVGVALYRAGDFGVERSPLGIRTEGLADFFANRSDVSFGILFGFERGFGIEGRFLRFFHLDDEVLLHHPREAVQRRPLARGRWARPLRFLGKEGNRCERRKARHSQSGTGGPAEEVATGGILSSHGKVRGDWGGRVSGYSTASVPSTEYRVLSTPYSL